ncbi:MAG: TlpA family protein disulfide reductase [Planctomycetes bacterium]|nr:TlpA family protein disulfide reductase [Planctomycetota bacterium]
MLATEILFGLVLLVAQGSGAAPTGTPAQQVAAIQAELEAARAAYIEKIQQATTSAERDRLMGEAPPPTPFAERVLEVAVAHPRDPVAIDALLWVLANSSPGSESAPCNRARAALLTQHLASPQLVPFAVVLAATLDAGHEDALRRLAAASPVATVQSAARFGLALQLLRQADSIELHQVRCETAGSAEELQRIEASLEQDFGPPMAQRMRERTPQALRKEVETLLQGLTEVATSWPAPEGESPIALLTRRELECLRTLATGKPAPATTGKSLEGDALALEDYRGQVVLLVFSAQWCTACRHMYPLERELTLTHAERPFTLFGVNGDPSLAVARKAAADEEMTWPVLWDGPSDHGPLATLWNVRGWPRVVLIDAKGIIRYTFRGAPDATILVPLVERLVREAEGSGGDAR